MFVGVIEVIIEDLLEMSGRLVVDEDGVRDVDEFDGITSVVTELLVKVEMIVKGFELIWVRDASFDSFLCIVVFTISIFVNLLCCLLFGGCFV